MARHLRVFEAAMAGPRLIARRPLSVFAWGLLTVAGLGVIMALVFAVVGEPITDPDGVQAGDMVAEIVRQQMLMGPMNLILYALQAVLGAAVVRAVLRPRARETAAFLRVGVAELLLLVAQIAIGIGIGLVAVVLFMVAAAVAFGVGMASQTAGYALGAVLGLAALVAVWWLALRTALIPPMTVATRKLAFVEGWDLARGQVWPLLGVALLTVLILLLTYVLMIALMIGLAVAAGVAASWSNVDPDSLRPLLEDPWRFAPWLIGAGLLMAVWMGVFQALAYAPWADAYRQLAGDGEAEA